MEHLKNYIGGEMVAAGSGGTLDDHEPATGQVQARVPDSDAADVERAVTAAAQAFPGWAATPARERARMLRAIAQRIDQQRDRLARAESADTGKPLALAAALDIPRASANFEFFADAATQFSSELHLSDAPGAAALNYTLRPPLGVVGCISPWNLPLLLLTWKVAPALAAGNCVVAKPSEVTPMTAHLLGEICREVGLPPGVLNIVHGLGAKVGAAMSAHPGIAAISFTGSTRTGAEIARTAGPAFKKLSLELGGKNPTVIFADADLEEALATTMRAAFSNQGQICLCGSRILVERSIYDRVREELVERARRLRVGDPLEPSTDQGAVVSRAHFDKVMGCIETARAEGGRLLVGGAAVQLEGRCRRGWFIAPTLFEGLGPGCRTNQEEIFGPVATLLPFDDDEDAARAANATRYGLSASVWTRDLARAHRFAARLESGVVWVNCWMLRDLRTPFGGVKDSGVGREGGLDAMRFFTGTKNVCVKV